MSLPVFSVVTELNLAAFVLLLIWLVFNTGAKVYST